MEKHRGPLDSSLLSEYDLVSCVLRFLGTASFGLFVDIVVVFLFVVTFLMGYAISMSTMAVILLAIPLIWGILGIFFFHEILDVTNEICGNFFAMFR